MIGSLNNDTAQRIYRRARKKAGEDEVLFRKLVVDGLTTAGLPVPKKFSGESSDGPIEKPAGIK
jgi:hypothetical protein